MASLRHGGGVRLAEAPSHVSAANGRSGCSSAEPYPLVCRYGLSATHCSRQAPPFSSSSSIAKYCLTSAKLHFTA